MNSIREAPSGLQVVLGFSLNTPNVTQLLEPFLAVRMSCVYQEMLLNEESSDLGF